MKTDLERALTDDLIDRRRLRAIESTVSAIGYIALGTLLAYVAIGAAGWL